MGGWPKHPPAIRRVQKGVVPCIMYVAARRYFVFVLRPEMLRVKTKNKQRQHQRFILKTTTATAAEALAATARISSVARQQKQQGRREMVEEIRKNKVFTLAFSGPGTRSPFIFCFFGAPIWGMFSNFVYATFSCMLLHFIFMSHSCAFDF